MKISFFKTSKPKSFSYKPLFYNERKEELENIRKSVQGESSSHTGDRVRVQIERSWRERRGRQSRKTPISHLRLLIYIAAIALVVYLLYFAKIF